MLVLKRYGTTHIFEKMNADYLSMRILSDLKESTILVNEVIEGNSNLKCAWEGRVVFHL